MRFRSPTDEPVYLALTSGHTASVSPEGTDLDPRFHKTAIAQGCLPEGIADVKQEPNKPAFDRKEVISAALQSMLDGSDPTDFTTEGKPALAKLNSRLGFQASRSEVDAIWKELGGSSTAEGKPKDE